MFEILSKIANKNYKKNGETYYKQEIEIILQIVIPGDFSSKRFLTCQIMQPARHLRIRVAYLEASFFRSISLFLHVSDS